MYDFYVIHIYIYVYIYNYIHIYICFSLKPVKNGSFWFIFELVGKKKSEPSTSEVTSLDDVANSEAKLRKLVEVFGDGWLGYIGDEILPSYIGIIINHCKDPD